MKKHRKNKQALDLIDSMGAPHLCMLKTVPGNHPQHHIKAAAARNQKRYKAIGIANNFFSRNGVKEDEINSRAA